LASCLCVNYDAVQAGKMLIVPTPRLRTGLFNHIKPPADGGVAVLKACATRQVGLMVAVNHQCSKTWVFKKAHSGRCFISIVQAIYVFCTSSARWVARWLSG